MAEQIQTKQCIDCKQYLSTSEFNKNHTRSDGLQDICKVCKALRQIEYRKTTSGKLAQKRYSQSEKGKCAKKRKAYKYNQSEKGKSYRKLSRKKHPAKYNARKAVNHAIEAGKLIAPRFLVCSFCPKSAQQYHHHKGYKSEHWLDVIPVCRKCHKD